MEENPNQEHRRIIHGYHPYVPNWSDILPPPPPLEMPPPIPNASSSQIINETGSNPQSPKLESKKSLHQSQNVIIYQLYHIKQLVFK